MSRSRHQARQPVGESGAAEAFAERAFRRLECEHIAALLKSPEMLTPVVSSFFELGAARNGWLVHGSLPGQAGADGARLERAGLDVSRLTRRGQLEIMEIDPALAPREWVRPWCRLLDERTETSFDAMWFSRFPVGDNDAENAAVQQYEEAWMRCFDGRRVVTLCPYIYAGMSADARAVRLREIASVHERAADVGELG